MIKTLDMQFIRYANLFDKVTRIRTNHCFEYNNMKKFKLNFMPLRLRGLNFR